MRTLHLTSPFMHGTDVGTLQTLLIHHGWLDDVADGQYGPHTAQAVYRAKYWLGYARPDQNAGDLLRRYLEGQKPTQEMAVLAAKRKAAKPPVPMRQHALAWLSGHLGDKESPAGSNKVPWASGWYGIVGPWCAMAVSRAYVEAGSKAFMKGHRYAYVPFIVADARAAVNGLVLTKEPKPGDLVAFDWDRDGVADHVGLFEAWRDPGATLTSIEGNTGIGNDSNGGEVMRRTRTVSQVQAFVRVTR